MNEKLKRPRLFVEYELKVGVRVPTTQKQSNYLRNVMRRKNGDLVLLFNGRQGEWLACISYQDRTGCTMTVKRRLHGQTKTLDIWLLFSPVKSAAMQNIARMATELGIMRLCPVTSRYTAVTRANTARLRANAVEAAEQSERLDIPEVDAEIPLTEIIRNWNTSRQIILCAEGGTSEPVSAVFDRLKCDDAYALMVGPEGGFEKSELDGLTKLPFVTPVHLGKRILRSDTAVVSVLACWQNVLGDWSA
tara:strand:+ start:857 stop:1600 length:744 start_codon:yes stop_codon:yes gene_type:complete